MGTPELIRANGLSYYYGNRKILDRISFVVYKNDRIALLGKNGSGKSTLLKGINHLIRKCEGEMYIDRDELKKGHETEMYTIFSEPDQQILMSTVYEEIALGLLQQNKSKEEIHGIVTASLKQFNMLRYIHESPYNLSTGEKKKLLLATALSLNPAALILDEPFSGLDVRSRNELCCYIQNIECTKIIATHEYEYARMCCNRAFVLYESSMVCFDNILDLLDNPETLKKYDLI